jgi:aryl-alcohol dehydrogenase-like predicted oxidoreductase
MEYRKFGRTNWQVSEVGYGMWGMGEWSGTDLQQVANALDRSVELGCNFFDTAWAYGAGKSENLLGELIKRHPSKKLFAASKIPPKNRQWPSKRGANINDVFPNDYIFEYVEHSLKNLGLEQLDLMQFHVWEDDWAERDEWKMAIQKLTDQGKVAAWGISINRWEPNNSLKTIRTGLIDAVQVIYNIFDQNPEDELFPLCQELEIAVIARVPFDEGTLTGTFTKETTFPKDDWRSTYFVPENLISSVERADALRPIIPPHMNMPEMALRFILSNEDVSTVIPGMRQIKHVESNIGCSDGIGLKYDTLLELKKHRWDRLPTEWSQ